MARQYPEQYSFCMKPVLEGGLGMAEVLEYMGIPWRWDGKEGSNDRCKTALEQKAAAGKNQPVKLRKNMTIVDMVRALEPEIRRALQPY